MIISLSVSLAEIMSLGKAFFWSKPLRCPCCDSSRCWGHGFVLRYFDGLPTAIWLKRWRCPDCKTVHTARPQQFWPRFLADTNTIINSLFEKLSDLPWQRQLSRQRQQHWLHGFRIQSHFEGLPGLSIEELIARKVIIASHSTKNRAIPPYPHPAYLRLASTEPMIASDTG